MKIAIYKDTLGNGRGADAATAALAEGLSDRGHEVSLFTDDGAGFPGSPFPVCTFSAERMGQCDVIVSTGVNELLSLAAKMPQGCPPVLQQFHTRPRHVFKWKHPLRNRRIAAALRNVSTIQVLRPEFADEVRRIAPEVSVAVIGNWSVGASSCAPSREDAQSILCPGALNKDKNQELLIRSFGRVAHSFPEWTLDICGVGKPAWENRLRRLAERCAGSQIRFHGYCDLLPFYARCSFVALPSLDEAFPLILIDAASFGKAAVTAHDWIGAAKAEGGVVSRPSVGAFAECLSQLMSDSSLRRQLGEKARLFCLDRYSRDRILDEWERVLASVSKVN